MITPKEVNGEDVPIKLVKPPLFPSLELRDQGSQLIIKNYNGIMGLDNFKDYIYAHVITDHITKSNSTICKKIAEDYACYILNACNEWKLDPFILTAVITVESNFNRNAINSKSGAIGMMQILWKHHGKNIINAFGHINKKEDIFIAENGIDTGSWILYWYLRTYEGSYKKALKRYSGSSNDNYYNKVVVVSNCIKERYKEKAYSVSYNSLQMGDVTRLKN